ncbi:hypothetical protein AAHE18_08G193300 [Arachis hypogaea]
MNRMRLRGKVVFVGEAKYRRLSAANGTKKIQTASITRKESVRQPQREHEDVPVAPSSSSKEVRKDKKILDPNGEGSTKKLEVAVSKGNLNWLQKSLIGGTTKAIDFRSLQDMVAKNFPQVTQVRELGAYKALLTFDSVLNAEETYTFKMNSLLQFFHSVWRWDESEKSESRRVWLECFGVPLHIWTVDAFKKIGEQWGEVVGCDTGTESCASFSVGRVLIDTCVMGVINEWVHINVGTSGFEVLVKEVGQEVYSSQCTMEKWADKEVACVFLNKATVTFPGAEVTTSAASTKLVGHEDQAAMVCTERLGQEVEDEDRIVIP